MNRVHPAWFWIAVIALRIGLPDSPMRCSAKPTSSATRRVCSTTPEVSAEKSEAFLVFQSSAR